MKKVVFSLKLMVFIALMLLFIFKGIMPQYAEGYNASIVDKYHRLKSIDEPKMILVGDSNVAFGFDSEKIQQAFHMPVVNFGLHGGLGQAFHSDMIKSSIREGDIVILAPGNYNYGTADIADCVLAWLTIENHYELWEGISSQNYLNMLSAYPTYLKRAVELFITGTGNSPVDSAFTRTAFNEYGDSIFPRPKCVMTEGDYGAYFNSNLLSQAMEAYWNEYNEYVLSRGAILLMSCPPILNKMVTADIVPVQNNLEEKLDFPVISQLQDYIYPIEYFYNTGLHLNDTGVLIRTEQLIADLGKALEQRQK